MNTLRAWRLKVAVLMVPMLVAIGAWEVYQGTVPLTAQAQAQTHPAQLELNYLVCYRIRKIEGDRGAWQVELLNEFGITLVEVGGPRLLCVPTMEGRIVPDKGDLPPVPELTPEERERLLRGTMRKVPTTP